jgi:hypothetical protein
VSTESLSGSERRRSPRIPADHPVKLGAEMPADAECRCINISLGGVYCTLATKVALYTKMEVSIALPIVDGEGTVREIPVSFAGAVVRLEEAPSGEKGYRAALVFQDMSDETEWVIGKYLLQNYRRWRG